MNNDRPAAFEQDSAMQVRSRLHGRAKRRLAKDILKRSAQSRRLVLKTTVAGLAALIAGLLAFGELLALAV